VAYYVDTSALVKLVVAEPESAALRAWLTVAEREPVTCDLARTELVRVVRRHVPEAMLEAREVLHAMSLLSVTSWTFEEAGRLTPDNLCTLDAVHLAAALELGDDLDGIVTYDTRMADAARANGVAVAAPG
jgi:uncharacterized protein